ncbi:phosphatidylserine decarboxylase-domain-containing protein [Pisolithus sp. B1]|nr:phosphatidylserine decarboxylase-domain-containing protein [Pisolithus sp. B1]
MPRTTVCRWLPEDPAVVDAYVHDLLYTSRLVHGIHPDTCEQFAEVGQNLEEAVGQIDVDFDLSRIQHCYHFALDEQPIIRVLALHPIVEEFKRFIETEGVVYAAFNKMFTEAPPPTDPSQRRIRNYVDLMQAINTNLATAPTYRLGPSAMVAGVPYYGIIARFCNTHAGYEAFTHPGVNQRFYNVFTAWHSYLTSANSANVIHNREGGWLSTVALNAMVTSAGGDPQQQNFENFYICNPNAAHYGFNSYDELFVRELHPRHRAPTDPDNPLIINSACSSTVHDLYYNLKRTDEFWIKNTPYSLSHILAEDELTHNFVGGTLFQAMLGSLDYHRWRSPVKGTVEKIRLISGATPRNPQPTYYAACLDNNQSDLDVVSRSQDFVTAISTRALIFIRAEGPVGLMCFVGVGLGEVSTCNIVVTQGQTLRKGDELGQFHFGGSTHCLIFRPGLTVTPADEQGRELVGSKVQVGKTILTVAAQN